MNVFWAATGRFDPRGNSASICPLIMSIGRRYEHEKRKKFPHQFVLELGGIMIPDLGYSDVDLSR
jgi:hypothetical protein